MPFKSLAQEGYMHEHPEILGKKGLEEWDEATKGKHLPVHAPKMHTGGTVPKDGTYELKKGEQVIPAFAQKEEPSMSIAAGLKSRPPKKAAPKHLKEFHAKEQHDGKYHVTRHTGNPKDVPVEHTADNMSDLGAALEDHMGQPNEGEADVAQAGAEI